MIFKVLKEDARTKYKFDAAKTYIHSRFTHLRAEERRRVSADW